MKQTIITYLKDEPGVLNRISRLFFRLNYNIESIAAGRSEVNGITRVTIVCNHTDHYNQSLIIEKLTELDCVSAVKDISKIPSVIREYALLKVKSEPDETEDLSKIIASSRVKIIDNSDSIFILEATGDVEEVDSLIKELKKFNILEIMRSGKMAMVESSQDEHRAELKENIRKKSWATQQISDAIF